MTRARRGAMFDRAFWGAFLAVAILGFSICAVIFEHNYRPRVYRYSEDVIILEVGGSELDFNHLGGGFSIWWESDGRNERLWPR